MCKKCDRKKKKLLESILVETQSTMNLNDPIKIEYLGKKGMTPYYGQSGRRYTFGFDARTGYIERSDLGSFLDKSLMGRPIFRVIEEPKTAKIIEVILAEPTLEVQNEPEIVEPDEFFEEDLLFQDSLGTQVVIDEPKKSRKKKSE